MLDGGLGRRNPRYLADPRGFLEPSGADVIARGCLLKRRGQCGRNVRGARDLPIYKPRGVRLTQRIIVERLGLGVQRQNRRREVSAHDFLLPRAVRPCRLHYRKLGGDGSFVFALVVDLLPYSGFGELRGGLVPSPWGVFGGRRLHRPASVLSERSDRSEPQGLASDEVLCLHVAEGADVSVEGAKGPSVPAAAK